MEYFTASLSCPHGNDIYDQKKVKNTEKKKSTGRIIGRILNVVEVGIYRFFKIWIYAFIF